MHAGKYKALYQYKGLNMVTCEIGTATGTTGTGDVVIIPATQSAFDNPTTVRNPLPAFLTKIAPNANPANNNPVLLSSNQAGLLTATNSGNSGNNPAIIAGSDEYLGTMTHISNGNVNLATRFTTVAATAGNTAG